MSLYINFLRNDVLILLLWAESLNQLVDLFMIEVVELESASFERAPAEESNLNVIVVRDVLQDEAYSFFSPAA